MTAKHSAGLLVFRRREGRLEVLLAHPGGPFWARKDDGAWSIPKGLCEAGEDPLAAARREFREETGLEPEGDFIPLDPVKQAGGKIVSAWAVECGLDIARFRSNSFAMQWPPRSGKTIDVPEIDRIAWFDVPTALVKIVKGQRPLIEQLMNRMNMGAASSQDGERPGLPHRKSRM